MTLTELEREIEMIDKAAASNNDTRFMAGLQARALWQIALQLARMNERANDAAANAAWFNK